MSASRAGRGYFPRRRRPSLAMRCRSVCGGGPHVPPGGRSPVSAIRTSAASAAPQVCGTTSLLPFPGLFPVRFAIRAASFFLIRKSFTLMLPSVWPVTAARQGFVRGRCRDGRLCTPVYLRRTRHAGGILCGAVAASLRSDVGGSWRRTIGACKVVSVRPRKLLIVFCYRMESGKSVGRVRDGSGPRTGGAVLRKRSRRSEDFQGDCGAGFRVGKGVVVLLQVVAADGRYRRQPVVGKRPAEGVARSAASFLYCVYFPF